MIERWYRVASQPQAVRVIGIEPSRAAASMVDADFLLKRIINGSDDPGIPGFKSLLAMRVEQLRSRPSQENESDGGSLSIERFWLFPSEETHFVEADDGILINGLSVQLGTESEYLAEGELRGKGVSDPLAKRFSDEFTEHFEQMKQVYPIYTDLENLFRMVALAKIMRYRKVEQEAGLDLSYLLDEFQFSSEPDWEVPSTVPGVSRVHTVSWGDDSERRRVRMALVGGVTIDLEASEERITADSFGVVARIVRDVFASRPAPNVLFWTVENGTS